LWKRWVALVALLFAGVVGTVQAVHIHGQWLPHATHELHAPALDPQSLGGEEHCPLCVAMHSTLPVALELSPVPIAVHVVLPAETEVPAPSSRWHFAMFSRPPPALSVV
jgi:hypothetical protein